MAIISSRPSDAQGEPSGSQPVKANVVPPADAGVPRTNAHPRVPVLPQKVAEDNQEESLRPKTIDDYAGQKDLKAVLSIKVAAAKARTEPLDHLLFYGPPGLGKTSISLILAQEMGVNIHLTTAPALERPRDIAGLLMKLQRGDILFIDEIHRLQRVTEEILYPAMEDYRLDITIGKGQNARITSVPLPRFTLIGATTRAGSLSSPLRDRFGAIQRLRFYDVEELTGIIRRNAILLNIPIDEPGAVEIARRSRGTPRIANRLLKSVRDYAQVKADGIITEAVASDALELFEVDPRGLDWTDRRLLQVLIEHYNGGPVGIESLAAATGEDTQTIEEVYEPYLMQIGYLLRTARGRVASAAAYLHLGYAPPLRFEQATLLD